LAVPNRVRDDVTMTTSEDDSRMSRRTWSFVMAACWSALGLWAMSAGQTWLGLAQLALGVSFVATALSPPDGGVGPDAALPQEVEQGRLT
jgi:hypothetical protein